MSELTLEQALILLDESRQHNAAMLNRLYESLGIDSSDGEIRFKWAMIAIGDVKSERDAALAQNAELVAQVGRMQTFIRMSADKWKNTPELEPTFLNLLRVANQQPEEALREICAEAGRAGFVAGYGKCWRESYGTKPNTDSVDEYADSYADRVKAGEV